MKLKYRNRPTRLCGIRFDSKAEAMRYLVLQQLEREKKITNLERQVKFPLHVNGSEDPVTTYVADFRYTELDDDGAPVRTVVEDKKGVETEAFKIKRKLMKAVHGIEILVT